MSASTMWKYILLRCHANRLVYSVFWSKKKILAEKTKKQSKSSAEQKEMTHTPTLNIWQDLRSCPLECWFSTSLLCNVNFLDKLKATENVCYVIKSPNFGCNKINTCKV